MIIKHFIALITFTPVDDLPMDFSDYVAGVGMWLCIAAGITFSILAINLWVQL